MKGVSKGAPEPGVAKAQRELPTSPFSSWNSSKTFDPFIDLLMTSDATQPSAVSGCHALVPTS